MQSPVGGERCGKFVKLGLDNVGLEVASPVQSSQDRENLGIDVRRRMRSVGRDPTANGAAQLVVQWEIDKRGRIDYSLSHDAWGASSRAASIASRARSWGIRSAGVVAATAASQASVEREARLRLTASCVTAERFKPAFLASAASSSERYTFNRATPHNMHTEVSECRGSGWCLGRGFVAALC